MIHQIFWCIFISVQYVNDHKKGLNGMTESILLYDGVPCSISWRKTDQVRQFMKNDPRRGCRELIAGSVTDFVSQVALRSSDETDADADVSIDSTDISIKDDFRSVERRKEMIESDLWVRLHPLLGGKEFKSDQHPSDSFLASCNDFLVAMFSNS